jgi:hypothetical protein
MCGSANDIKKRPLKVFFQGAFSYDPHIAGTVPFAPTPR